MSHRTALAIALSALTAALAACSAHQPPPADQDVTAAVRALLQQQSVTFGGDAATVVSVQAYACSPAPDHRGFLCETAIALAPPAKTQQRLVRMVRTPSGWQATLQ